VREALRTIGHRDPLPQRRSSCLRHPRLPIRPQGSLCVDLRRNLSLPAEPRFRRTPDRARQDAASCEQHAVGDGRL